MQCAEVTITGTVQSVGFRPFVYRVATEHGLTGHVRNRGDAGVRMLLCGGRVAVEAAIGALTEDPPPLAEVRDVDVVWETVDLPPERFTIESSSDAVGAAGSLPPDTAPCERCRAELSDSSAHFGGYWAISCVDCGPRYTITRSLPYDRAQTSLSMYPLCDRCQQRFDDPGSRRYHAQAIACAECGPGLWAADAADADRVTARGSEAISSVAQSIGGGQIALVRGIGGAHLVCDATDAGAVSELRDRTNRQMKPFAVMAPDYDTATSLINLDAQGSRLLRSPRRPIVVAPSRRADVAPPVAPQLDTLGVMLPYSGLHQLLFEHIEMPVVMTSANLPGQPMPRTRAELADVAPLADIILGHDRPIVARCDDSVVRSGGPHPTLLRRSRGYVPAPITLPVSASEPLVALGADADVTVATVVGDRCHLSAHLGRLDSVSAIEAYTAAVEHHCGLTGVTAPTQFVHDLHPGFASSVIAKERAAASGAAALPVQHHHAHAASVLAEHHLSEAVIITVDGTGLGTDDTIWGGEVLACEGADYERVGGLSPFPLIGGERAIRDPARIAVGLLTRGGLDVAELAMELGLTLPAGRGSVEDVLRQLDADINVIETSSAGRFLDAVASMLLGIDHRSYRGAPAIMLEAAAGEWTRPPEPSFTFIDGRRCLDTPALYETLAMAHVEGVPVNAVAARAQAELAYGLATIAVDAARQRGIDRVGLSGGVAANRQILQQVASVVDEAGLRFVTNERVPPGDGGIALGQAYLATRRLQDGEST